MQQVTMSIHGKTLLSDITLDCEPGSVLGIVGENGAGKSTLLNALAGVTPPSDGMVTINGLSLNTLSPATLAQIRAVLPQSNDLSFPLNALEVVRLALSLSRLPIERQDLLLKQCLSRFNVLKLAYRNYASLSGGEKQRVQLARVTAQLLCHQCSTLVHKPQYLLLDEPISALDLYQQYQTLRSVRQLASDGIGVVVILHDLNLASLYCDTVAILKNGELLTQGPPSTVMTEENIQQAFNIGVRLQPHPDTNTPFITPRVLI